MLQLQLSVQSKPTTTCTFYCSFY